jgi:hypothetical protein
MSEWRTLAAWKGVKWPYEQFRFGVPISVFVTERMLEEVSWFAFAATRWILPLWVLFLGFRLWRRRRFVLAPSEVERGEVWGGIVGIVGLWLALTADVALNLRHEGKSWSELLLNYYGGWGLNEYTSWWIAGFPLVMLAWLALSLAGHWQRTQLPPPEVPHQELAQIGAEHRINIVLQRAFPPLARYSLVLAALAAMVWYFGSLPVKDENFDHSSVFLLVPIAGLLLPLFVSILRRRRRLDTLRLAGLVLTHAFGGYLVAVWLCLGLAILAALPGLLNFDAQFQRTLQEGEMPLFRSMVGL